MDRRSVLCLVVVLTGVAVIAASAPATAEPGDVMWNVSVGDDEWGGLSATIVNGTVYVGGPALYAIDAKSGEIEWKQSTTVFVSTPNVADGTVYVANNTGTVYAFDASTGEEQWNVSSLPPAIVQSPLATQGRLYLGRSGSLYALDAANGDVLWNDTVVEEGILTAPTVLDGKVFIATTDGKVLAYDATTGESLWIWRTPKKLGHRAATDAVTVANGTVYLAEQPGQVIALDADDGSVQWAREKGIGGTVSIPTVLNETVFVGTSGQGIVALSASHGTVEWRYEIEDGVLRSSPTVTDDTVYIASNAGDIHAVNADNGNQRWVTSIEEKQITSSPTIVNGRLYIGSFMGNIYALKVEDNALSRGSRVVQGTIGHHDSFAEHGPMEPDDSRLDSVNYGTHEPPSGDENTSDVDVTNASSANQGDQAVPGFSVLVAMVAVVLVAALAGGRGR